MGGVAAVKNDAFVFPRFRIDCSPSEDLRAIVLMPNSLLTVFGVAAISEFQLKWVFVRLYENTVSRNVGTM